MRGIAVIMFLSSLVVLTVAFLPEMTLDSQAHVSASQSTAIQSKDSML